MFFISCVSFGYSIDWDSPIHEILPCDFRLFDETSTKDVTLRDLLAHRTGIPGNFVPLLAGLDPSITTEEFVR